jgi:hypothetical protein
MRATLLRVHGVFVSDSAQRARGRSVHIIGGMGGCRSTERVGAVRASQARGIGESGPRLHVLRWMRRVLQRMR